MIDNDETSQRALQLRHIMNDFIRNRPPQERDRSMQVHLAQARGPVGNAVALRRLMDFTLRLGIVQAGGGTQSAGRTLR